RSTASRLITTPCMVPIQSRMANEKSHSSFLAVGWSADARALAALAPSNTLEYAAAASLGSACPAHRFAPGRRGYGERFAPAAAVAQRGPQGHRSTAAVAAGHLQHYRPSVPRASSGAR